jgi:hypothetical protein
MGFDLSEWRLRIKKSDEDWSAVGLHWQVEIQLNS